MSAAKDSSPALAGALAVLTAAGMGTRLGLEMPKALVPVGQAGVPMVLAAARSMAASGLFRAIVVTVPPGFESDFQALFDAEGAWANPSPVSPTTSPSNNNDTCEHQLHPEPLAPTTNVSIFPPGDEISSPSNNNQLLESQDKSVLQSVPFVVIVAGGASRQASVAAGLQALEAFTPQDKTPVLVHDAARCFTPTAVYDRVVNAVRAGYRAVIPVLPVSDTIKVLTPSANATMLPRGDQTPSPQANNDTLTTPPSHALPLSPPELVGGTVDRNTLRAVQTPQGFEWGLLGRAHRQLTALGNEETTAASDDAGLVEALGEKVWMVEGAPEAMKITTPWDLEIAKALFA